MSTLSKCPRQLGVADIRGGFRVGGSRGFWPPPFPKKKGEKRSFHCKIGIKTNLPPNEKQPRDSLEWISGHPNFFGFWGPLKVPRPPSPPPGQIKKTGKFPLQIDSKTNFPLGEKQTTDSSECKWSHLKFLGFWGLPKVPQPPFPPPPPKKRRKTDTFPLQNCLRNKFHY